MLLEYSRSILSQPEEKLVCGGAVMESQGKWEGKGCGKWTGSHVHTGREGMGVVGVVTGKDGRWVLEVYKVRGDISIYRDFRYDLILSRRAGSIALGAGIVAVCSLQIKVH